MTSILSYPLQRAMSDRENKRLVYRPGLLVLTVMGEVFRSPFTDPDLGNGRVIQPQITGIFASPSVREGVPQVDSPPHLYSRKG